MSKKYYLNLRNVYRKATEPTNFILKDHRARIHWENEKPYFMRGDKVIYVDQKFVSTDCPTPLKTGELQNYFGIEKYEARLLQYNQQEAFFGRTIEEEYKIRYLQQLELPILVAKKEKEFVYVVYQRYEFEGQKILKTLAVYYNKEKAKAEIERLQIADSRYEYIIDVIEFHS